MTDFQAHAVTDAINRMFKERHFSICTVDECMKVTGSQQTADYPALRLYHCKDFRDMDRETKDFVFRATVENICNVDDFPAVRLIKRSEEMESALAITKSETPLLKRLFGRI